jgi:translation initiation factor 3 subunit G
MDSYSNSLRSSFEDTSFPDGEHTDVEQNPIIDDHQDSEEDEQQFTPIEIENPVLEELKELLEYSIISRKEYERQVQILLKNLTEEPLKEEAKPVEEKEEPEEIELSRYEEIENKDGTFTTKTYTTNAEGQRILITRIVKRTKVQRKVPKRVIERRKILKFGRCAGQPPGPEEGVTQIGDLVHLETPKASDKKEEKKTNVKTVAAIKCRNCNEPGHWTKDCPHPRSALEKTKEIADALSEQSETQSESEVEDTKGSYVPPHLRKNAKSSHSNQPEEQVITSLRVINLDYEAEEHDLRTLFECVGRVKRATIARDRHTRESRGMGYVDMYSREDCEKAIERLDGHAYGQQVLHVEFVKPKKKF